MNIIQLEDNLKSLPDSNLENEMTNPSGMFPQYLVMSEIQRRKDMREDYAGRMAANEKTPPLPSMREEMLMGITQPQPPVQDSGIAGLLPAQPQGAPIPPAMSASPDVMPMYGGGIVGMNVGMEAPNIYDEEYEDYLQVLEKLPKGTAIGVNTLCSALNIDRQTIEQKIEPFLIRQGYVAKTSKGRILTK